MAKTGAAFYLRHDPVSKASQRKHNTAAAHFRYIARQSAVVQSYNDNFPGDWVEGIRFLNRREKTIRANGRVIDKIILNLPFSLTDMQRFRAVRDFVQAVGSGRIPAYFAIHGDTEAPHAHIIFVDADIDTGKRVFKFSDAGSTYRLRKIWEDVLNRHLELAETRLRVSRWGRDHPYAKEAEVANDNIKDAGTALSPPAAPKRPQQAVEADASHVVPPPQESAMDTSLVSTLEYAKDLIGTRVELEVLEGRVLARENARSEMKRLDDELKADESYLINYQKTLSQARANYERAVSAFVPYRGVTGGLRGFSFMGFKSRKRIAAEAAQAQLLASELTVTTTTHRVDDLRAKINRNRYKAAEQSAHYARMLDILGTDNEIADAKAVLVQAIEFDARNIDLIKLEKLVALKHLGVEDLAKVSEVKNTLLERERAKSKGKDLGGAGY